MTEAVQDALLGPPIPGSPERADGKCATAGPRARKRTLAESPLDARTAAEYAAVVGRATRRGRGGNPVLLISGHVPTPSDSSTRGLALACYGSGCATRLLGHALTRRSMTCHRVPLKTARRAPS
jgi:hypothetical protein